MSFRNAVQNPTANKLVAHIAASASTMVASNIRQRAHYNLQVTRSMEDNAPFVNFQLILVEEPDEVPHMTDEQHRAREEAVFVSKRRMVQVMMKALHADEFLIRFSEISEGEVFYFVERKFILPPHGSSRRHEVAARIATSYLTTGHIIDIRGS
jgi:hypothetical protein